jgi:molecular chaperone HscB
MQGGADHFTTLGIERKFFLDNAALERRFHQLQRASHPDNFAGAAHGVIESATDRSGDINAAYRTLRDHRLRERYLLSLYGLASDSSRAIPPSLFDLVMEVQEAVSHAEHGKTDSTTDLEKKLAAAITEIESQMNALEHQWDDTADESLLATIAECSASLSYLRTLRDTLTAAINGASLILKH